ncbi:hypothetical protein ACO1ZG_03730 [Enterobacter kobei]
MDIFDKVYSDDNQVYEQKTVSQRIEALFLNNLGKVRISHQTQKNAYVSD